MVSGQRSIKTRSNLLHFGKPNSGLVLYAWLEYIVGITVFILEETALETSAESTHAKSCYKHKCWDIITIDKQLTVMWITSNTDGG